MNKISSPCVKICKLNKNNVCLGCLRTLDEIHQWPKLTEEQRLEIIQDLEKRKDFVGP